MKDEEIDARSAALYAHAHAGFPACGVAVVPWQDVPECIRDAWRRALRAARTEAIDEAAKVAENTPDSGICTMSDVENDHAAKIAHAIRSLSSNPAGGHDGG